jgi:hypothetical protein
VIGEDDQDDVQGRKRCRGQDHRAGPRPVGFPPTAAGSASSPRRPIVSAARNRVKGAYGVARDRNAA